MASPTANTAATQNWNGLCSSHDHKKSSQPWTMVVSTADIKCRLYLKAGSKRDLKNWQGSPPWKVISLSEIREFDLRTGGTCEINNSYASWSESVDACLKSLPIHRINIMEVYLNLFVECTLIKKTHKQVSMEQLTVTYVRKWKWHSKVAAMEKKWLMNNYVNC